MSSQSRSLHVTHKPELLIRRAGKVLVYGVKERVLMQNAHVVTWYFDVDSAKCGYLQACEHATISVTQRLVDYHNQKWLERNG